MRRVRAKSPFLPTHKELQKLDWSAPLATALRELPDATDEIAGPLSVEDLPARVQGVRTELTQAQIQSALDKLQFLQDRGINAYAENSRRSMRSDWRHWIAFCATRNKLAMPIALDDVIEFFDALIDAGYKRATLEHLVFTLTTASLIWSCPSPFDDLLWKDYWRDRCRERLTKAQHQAAALNVSDIESIIASMDTNDPRSIRDTTFAALAYNLMTRASELVALRWDNIEFGDDGALCRIERSKTDQEGEGADIYVFPFVVELLELWRPFRFADNPFVFHALPRYAGQRLDETRPLNVREASRILARVGYRAGSEKTWTGHSGRVGSTQDLTRGGHSLAQIMQLGRWKSPAMPARYAAKEIAAKAGKDRMATLKKLNSDDQE